MSRVEVCSLAYEGKFNELKGKIDLTPSLATKVDESNDIEPNFKPQNHSKRIELAFKLHTKYKLRQLDLENERMPLHWAASGGHTDIVKYLLDLGVPTDNKDDSQWTPLMIAASAGRDAIVFMLISLGADVNSTNEGGQTPLHYAASRNRYEIAEVLLQSGACVNAQDKTSAATPLHRAASRGHSKMVKLLLNQNASCDVQDAEGNTALHMACEEGRAEIAVTLVENGANIYIQNKINMSPVELANKGLARQLIRLSDS